MKVQKLTERERQIVQLAEGFICNAQLPYFRRNIEKLVNDPASIEPVANGEARKLKVVQGLPIVESLRELAKMFGRDPDTYVAQVFAGCRS